MNQLAFNVADIVVHKSCDDSAEIRMVIVGAFEREEFHNNYDCRFWNGETFEIQNFLEFELIKVGE